jgi:hypothetical protein
MLKEKEKIKSLVLKEQYNELCELIKEKKNRLSTLLSLSYTTDNNTRFKVIKAAGYAVSVISDQELDFVRTVISNLLWSLNDDSGSIGWSSPELLGEIISKRIDLFKEYVPLVVSLLKIKETYFRPGVLWAMGRIAATEPSHIKPYAPYINMYLADPITETRGYAVWCLGQIGVAVPEEHRKHLLNDTSEILLLDGNGSISKKTIGELTQETLTQKMQ